MKQQNYKKTLDEYFYNSNILTTKQVAIANWIVTDCISYILGKTGLHRYSLDVVDILLLFK